MQIPLEKSYNKDLIENKWKEYWKEHNTYAFHFDEKRPTFSVDTPPPYVSADHLHYGHIMSFSQAEFIVRFKRMQGYNVFYTMGFDDNGLPTERFVEKKYNIDKSKTTKKEFVKLCLEETAKGAQTYRELWDNVGLSVDWSHTYSTINPLATKVSQRSLIDLYKKGHLHRKEMPIVWCTFCQTALAQADLEDMEEEAFMHVITFFDENNKKLEIATTRPELLPGCVAVYAHPDDERFSHLKRKKIRVPMFELSVPFMTSEKVMMEKGTGLMMVCTWGDSEDVDKWTTDKLESRQVFTADGKMNSLAGKYEGLTIENARSSIVEDLDKEGFLVRKDAITHTKNVHERCSTPANFLTSKQWFIAISDKKEIWKEQGEKLNWYPAHFKNEYNMWVEGLKWDWCISRQRFFGVPFPVWNCAKCEVPHFASEEELPVEPTETQPSISACPSCGHAEFIPEKDVLDTWATSSCTPFLLRELDSDEKQKEALFPATLRPNAHELIRTWDFYSVVKSYLNFGDIPFRDVMVSGHGLDSDGRKVSKRLGNFVSSEDLIRDHGADAIRYWATGANLGENLRFQIKEVEVGKKTLNKLWNVAKLIAMHAEEFEAGDMDMSKLDHADVWILSRLNETIVAMTKSFEKYEFAHAKNSLAEFFWSDLADRYIEFVKYRLWNEDMDLKHKALGVLYTVFENVLKLYAPFMPFITEELYQVMYAKESIHLSKWPEVYDLTGAVDISDFDTALASIDEIRKHKSDNQLSLGAELETYEMKTAVDKEKYGTLIEKVMRVGKLQ